MVRSVNIKTDLCFRNSCEIFGWLTILDFPVNFLGDWLLPNIKCWKLSTAQVVGEGESVSWGGARTKGKGREWELTKKMSLHSDLLNLRQKKKHNITKFFPNTNVFYD